MSLQTIRGPTVLQITMMFLDRNIGGDKLYEFIVINIFTFAFCYMQRS
jgi:hypothetical protein